MEKETYTIEIVCENCGHKQEVEIPKGKRFTNANYFNGNFARIGGTKEGYFYDEQIDCKNCGCGELVKVF